MADRLSYQLATDPIPLQVNWPGQRQQSRIDIAAFTADPPVYCSYITMQVPVGTEASDFCLESPSPSVNAAKKWTVAGEADVANAQPDDDWQVIFTNLAPDQPIDYPLVFSFTGIVNYTVGDFACQITEMSGAQPPSKVKPTPKVTSVPVTKHGPTLTLRNFHAESTALPHVLLTSVGNGDPFRLAWESNGRWFELYAKGKPDPIHSGPETFYDVPKGMISSDTLFILAASVANAPGSGSFRPVYLYDALTVVVADPDLTPKSVAATGSISGGQVAGETLTVSGRTTMTGGFDVGKPGDMVTSVLHSKLKVDTMECPGLVKTQFMLADQVKVVAQLPNPAGWFEATASSGGKRVDGINIKVKAPGDIGLSTNGKIVSGAGAAMLTHVPTRAGHAVVTSPLVTAPQVHLSGSARLAGGRARVTLDAADLIHHAADAPYVVVATPTGQCSGLVIAEKGPDYFVVEEVAGGRGEVSFDWMVIARQRSAEDAAAAMELPAALGEPASLDT